MCKTHYFMTRSSVSRYKVPFWSYPTKRIQLTSSGREIIQSHFQSLSSAQSPGSINNVLSSESEKIE